MGSLWLQAPIGTGGAGSAEPGHCSRRWMPPCPADDRSRSLRGCATGIQIVSFQWSPKPWAVHRSCAAFLRHSSRLSGMRGNSRRRASRHGGSGHLSYWGYLVIFKATAMSLSAALSVGCWWRSAEGCWSEA